MNPFVLAAALLLGSPVQTFEITAYTHTGNRTASGAWPVVGMAACPRRFEFGAQLYVEGVGIVTCADRGGDIHGDRLDLFLESRSAALAWGRRSRRVRFLAAAEDA